VENNEKYVDALNAHLKLYQGIAERFKEQIASFDVTRGFKKSIKPMIEVENNIRCSSRDLI
jgi:hypothetical protein